MIADGVTYVLQGRNVVPNLSVLHNIELGQTRMHNRAAALLADPRVGQPFLGGHIQESAA